jgi:H+/Cl- antiporter ClcA
VLLLQVLQLLQQPLWSRLLALQTQLLHVSLLLLLLLVVVLLLLLLLLLAREPAAGGQGPAGYVCASWIQSAQPARCFMYFVSSLRL